MKRIFLFFAVLASGTLLTVQAQVNSYYPFNKDVKDATGWLDGTLKGNTSIVMDEERGPVLEFNNPKKGSENGFVLLPSEILFTDSISISCWAKLQDTDNAYWTRLWDFGCNTTHYLMLSLSKEGNFTPIFAIKHGGGYTDEQHIDYNGFVVDKVAWHHYVVTVKAKVAILYIDGVEVGRNEALSISPFDIYAQNAQQNYLGKSHYNDQPFVGRMDELRVTSQVFTPQQVDSIYKLKPDYDITNSLEAERDDSGFEVYASGQEIRVSSSEILKTVSVSDLAGREVARVNPNSQSAVLITSGFAPGLYLVKSGNLVRKVLLP